MLDHLSFQLGVDRRVAPVTLSISSGQNTIGYFSEDENTHVFAREPEATGVSTVLLKASPGSDTMGMVFQIMREGQTAWSTNNSVLALIIAIAQCVDPALAASLADGSASPEEIKALASKLSEADPGIQALCDSLDPASKADVAILLGLLGQISTDPTNLTSLLNLMNIKDFGSLAALTAKVADLSVSPIAFYGKTQVMLLPSIGNYWVRVVPFDNVLNMETSDIPTKISVVPVEADIVKITQISLDANGDGDIADRYEKGDYSVEPPELYKIFFADDDQATLTAGIVHRTGNPFSVTFQYALQSAPDEWQDIKTVPWDKQSDTIELDWVFGTGLKTAFQSLFEASADKTQPLVFVRAVATNELKLTDPSPYVAEVLLDEVRAVPFSLLLRAGLSMFSIPVANSQASIAGGEPVAMEQVGDLKTLLGEDTPVYYYSASGGKFEEAPVDMEITGDQALITMLLEDTIVKFEGEGWPGDINLVAGLNMFAVPLDADQTVADLKALLGEGAPVYYYHSAEGKFQEAADDMPIEGGMGYITIMLEPTTISIAGNPWENEGVSPPLAPSFFDPTATLLMEVKGNVINADTDAAFNDLSVIVRHQSSNAVITDTTDGDGQFSAVFLDIFKNQSYRIGDVFKIDIQSNSGDIRFEPMQYTVTQEDVKRGRIILSNLTVKAIPKYSKLLQNWPNPFNPETWIPFQLSKDADVTLTIYDIQGRLVRRLDVGYIPAGIYSTKHNAIYWNGTNDSGERVSSGIYFYHIQAGKFSASRKMVILK
ncbi:T9SS type A sorting domain-containing protein [Candidatus Poribacteria bacterium]|nr:T9SS type A sorting domain-containing protein [Candidatus Poribacteria bacterium]